MVQAEGDNRAQVLRRLEIKDERRVRDQEYQFLVVAYARIICHLANLAHKERLVLRMQVQFRFVDDKRLLVIVVKMS